MSEAEKGRRPVSGVAVGLLLQKLTFYLSFVPILGIGMWIFFRHHALKYYHVLGCFGVLAVIVVYCCLLIGGMSRLASVQRFGQVYVPLMNWLLCIGCVSVVLGFGSSERIASAYGLAVTLTMLATTLLMLKVAIRQWFWSRLKAVAIFGPFLVIELIFFAGNIPKTPQGGCLPLATALVIYFLISVWRQGRLRHFQRMRGARQTWSVARAEIAQAPRCPGVAIYLGADEDQVSLALTKVLAYFGSVSEHIVFLKVDILETPGLGSLERLTLNKLQDNCYRAVLRFGYLEESDVPRHFGPSQSVGTLDLSRPLFVLGVTEVSVPEDWSTPRRAVFQFLALNERRVTHFFKIPVDQMLEVGVTL